MTIRDMDLTHGKQNLNVVVLPLELVVVIAEDVIKSAAVEISGALAVECSYERRTGSCRVGAHGCL